MENGDVVIDDVYPPIVGKEIWETAQKQRQEGSRDFDGTPEAPKVNASNAVLSGLLFCACGSPMRVTGYRFLWKPVAKMVPSEEKPMADVIADKRGEMAGPTGVKPTQEEIRKEFLGDDANDTDPNAYDNEEYFDK